MADLILIVPTRGRPHAVAELAESFSETCTADTFLVLAVDDDDPELEAYQEAVDCAKRDVFGRTHLLVQEAPGNMANALNFALKHVLDDSGHRAVGFMGDDHRPRTRGWDASYVGTLLRQPGIVYGNDLIHGQNLPTQFAVSESVARAVGFLSPPGLRHMYIDNYWRDIGKAAGVLTYLDGVVVEHMHPVAAKSEYDEGYARVNAPEVFDHDRAVYEAYMAASKERDVALIREAVR